MTINIIKDGKTVASSKNLEVVTRYARTHSPIKKMYMEHDGYTLLVVYKDGAVLKTKFGDHEVLRKYLLRRGQYM